MVGMHVRVDHVADRLGGPCTDRGQQAAALADAAAGIDHRNGVVADDKCDVGNGAFVVAAHERQGAGVNEDPGRHFRHGKRLRSSFVGNWEVLRMGTRRQLCVGNMYRAHGEHECRSNRRQPVTHAHASRVGPMPSQRHHQISMVHNHSSVPWGDAKAPCCDKWALQRLIVPNLFVADRSGASIDFHYGFRLQERQVKGNPDVSS